MINDAGKQAVKSNHNLVTEGLPAVRALLEQIEELDVVEIYGRVVGVRGLMVEVAGPCMPCRLAPASSSRPKGRSRSHARWSDFPAAMRC